MSLLIFSYGFVANKNKKKWKLIQKNLILNKDLMYEVFSILNTREHNLNFILSVPIVLTSSFFFVIPFHHFSSFFSF